MNAREAFFLLPREGKSVEGSGTKLSNKCLLLMLILTVEDEFLIGEYLRAILEGSGHTVLATFDADEAIKVLERVHDIQLVITDINMPGSMDGLQIGGCSNVTAESRATTAVCA
jgi:DNA-binding response OmpR family regulator